jgi:LysM repeat protein
LFAYFIKRNKIKMKKIFCFILLLPIFAFAQTKVNKNTAVTKPKPTVKTTPKDKQPPKAKPVPVAKPKPVVKPKPVAVPKPAVKPTVKPAAIVKGKPKVKAEPKEVLKATMHTVGAKETLYGISKMYSVKVDDIKKWNKLTSDALVEGMELIVGFGTEIKKPIVQVEPETGVVNQDADVDPKPVVKPEPKKKPVTKLPDVNPISEDKVVEENEAEKKFKGGFFKSLYKDNGKILEGTAGVFKSTSGWDDGKYYCLHNSAKQGTIIKIINTANGKSVYAKVLDIMPDLKQNDKLIIRISAAAAEALGEIDVTSMNVAIAY